MARYHFNVRDGTEHRDVDGTECPSLGHAQREAVRLAGYLLMTQPGTFWTGQEWCVEATDQTGRVLFVVKFQAQDVALVPA